MNKTQLFLRKYSPIALTTISAVGVIATTVLGIKATPKALELIKKAEKEKGDKLDVKETIKVAWKPYIPTAISGFGTISCIIGIYCLSGRTQASLASAYAVLDNMHKEYVNKVEELYGDDADEKVRTAIAEYHSNDLHPLNNDTQLFFDYESMRYFESSINDVLKAENDLNAEFAASGFATLNEFYHLLGIKGVTHGEYTGWYAPGDYYEIIFEHEKVIIDDGLEVYLINMITNPSTIAF